MSEDQVFKADAGKMSPRTFRPLPFLERRVALWRGMPDWTYITQAEEWAERALKLLPLKHRTIGMYRAFRFGEEKYEAFSWREVVEGRERYACSSMRHFLPEIFYPGDRDEWLDKESGLHHYDHAAASLAIVLDLLNKKKVQV